MAEGMDTSRGRAGGGSSGADDKDSKVTGIWVVGDALALTDEALGLPVHRIPDAKAASVQNFGNVAFVIKDFDGPDFQLVQAMIKAKEAKNALGGNSCIVGPSYVKAMIKAAQVTSATGRDLIQGSSRPLYCNSMDNLGICFNSHRRRNKDEVQRYFFLIQSMGGSIYKDISTSRVTHLVADNCRGERYRYASTFGIPIMAGSWLEAAWNNRHDPDFKADSKAFIAEHKVKPFHGAVIYFEGFQEEERLHMVEELLRNGGTECRDFRRDTNCTHVVVDDSTVTALPADVPKEVPVVKSEWFWASIQMDACAEEKLHVFSDHIGALLSPVPSATAPVSSKVFDYSNSSTGQLVTTPLGQHTIFSPGTPGSSSSAHSRKRKRRKEVVNQLAQNDPIAGCPKRRSSVSELALLSMSGSLLDTPDRTLENLEAGTVADNQLGSSPNLPSINIVTSPMPGATVQQGTSSSTPKRQASAQGQTEQQPVKQITPRQHVFHELVQTETNYVNILRTILDVFKKPLEDPNLAGGELLNATEMRIIFGNLPPIYEVHSAMLQEFQSALGQKWREDFSIGDVFLKYANDLLKAYPPYVNFLEDSKRRLMDCDKSKPRFHAFLKVCQSRPECGRQSLTDLMTRPVQRLPSVSLLLTDLIKHTKKEKDHKDLAALESALGKIKEILNNINEDKRKTEGQVCLFEIFSDIQDCPPSLVSSHRSFCNRIDVIELGGADEMCAKGYELSLLLFSDVLEIAKRRSCASKGLGLKSPSTMSLRSVGLAGGGVSLPQGNLHDTLRPGDTSSMGGGGAGMPGMPGSKPMKHISMMNLSEIKRVVDIVDEEATGRFALVCRTNQELKERMFVFQIVNESDADKLAFLRYLCRNIAHAVYRPDPDTYLKRMRVEDLGLDASDLNVAANFGSSVYRSIHRKVNRAFSFNKTPTGSRLKRAMSSMISPIKPANSLVNPTGSTTPSGDLQNLRLASCTNLLQNRGQMPAQPNFESPKSSRMSIGGGMAHFASSASMMPPPSMPPGAGTPKRGMASMAGIAASSSCLSPSPAKMYSENINPTAEGFMMPKTPTSNLAKRRPSFKFKGSSLMGGGSKNKN